MSSTAHAVTENISNLSHVIDEYPAPIVVAECARQQNWIEEHRRSVDYPEAFWTDYARNFEWSAPWDEVMDFDGVHHKWFTGARTTISINALDSGVMLLAMWR